MQRNPRIFQLSITEIMKKMPRLNRETSKLTFKVNMLEDSTYERIEIDCDVHERLRIRILNNARQNK